MQESKVYDFEPEHQIFLKNLRWILVKFTTQGS